MSECERSVVAVVAFVCLLLERSGGGGYVVVVAMWNVVDPRRLVGDDCWSCLGYG